MEIIKSSRHAKITGDFGEAIVLYWLSKYGFECASVDHTGIDIIARNSYTKEVMGISVKSRSRNEGKEEEHVSIPNDNFDKTIAACAAFGCAPYFAVVVDASDVIRGYLLPMQHLLSIHPMGKTVCSWTMRTRDVQNYEKDPNIKSFVFRTSTQRWW